MKKNSSDSLWLEGLGKSGVSGFVWKGADTIQQTTASPSFFCFQCYTFSLSLFSYKVILMWNSKCENHGFNFFQKKLRIQKHGHLAKHTVDSFK